jgi:PKD repeat protein
MRSVVSGLALVVGLASSASADLIVSVVPEQATVAGDTVTFDGNATGGTGTLQIQWDFNYDGSTFNPDPAASGTFTPSHTFIDPSNYTVALEVTDSLGQTGIGDTVVTVATSGPITLSILPVSPAVVGEAVNFTASETGGTTPLQIQWDFNYDGSTFNPDPAAAGSLTPSHTFLSPGQYEVAVQVTDSNGLTTTFPTPLVVETPEPSSLVTLLIGGSLTLMSCRVRRQNRPRP